MDGLEERLFWGFGRALAEGYRAEPGELVKPAIKHPPVIDYPIADFRGCWTMPAERIHRDPAIFSRFVSR
jgi:hypothetical protein